VVRLSLAALGLVLAACAHRAVPRATIAPPPAAATARPEAERTYAVVESLRGLSRSAPFTVEAVGAHAFLAAYRAHVPRLNVHEVHARMLWFGFDLGEADVDEFLDDLDRLPPLLYEHGRRRVVLESPTADAMGDALTIEIALQHQRFGFDVGAETNRDRALARQALAMGDAFLVALAAAHVRASNATVPVIMQNILDHLRDFVTAGQPDVAKVFHVTNAPPLLREEATFGVISGLWFVATLYRHGGFALIDRAFAAPPTSTMQILHPELYEAGVLPVEPPAPEVPPGFTVVSRGTIGEFGLRVLLAAHARPLKAGDGWRGDRYLLAEDAGHRMVLLWITTWEDGGNAGQFKNQLVRHWHPWDADSDDEDFLISEHHERVVAVRGLKADERAELLKRLRAQAGF
jgi:hypothetical protein